MIFYYTKAKEEKGPDNYKNMTESKKKKNACKIKCNVVRSRKQIDLNIGQHNVTTDLGLHTQYAQRQLNNLEDVM